MQDRPPAPAPSRAGLASVLRGREGHLPIPLRGINSRTVGRVIGTWPGGDLSGVVRPQFPDGKAFRALLRRVGLLVVAILVVLMHHVVGAQEHGSSAAMQMPAAPTNDPAVPSTAVPHPAVVHVPRAALATVPVADEPARITGATTSPAMTTPGAPLPMSAMLHLCLAVLVAVGLVVALNPAVISSPSGWWPAMTSAGAFPAFPRPPPSLRRLARLQVLRL